MRPPSSIAISHQQSAIDTDSDRDSERSENVRVLVLATTTGYQTRAFGDAAEQLGVELVFATDRCHLIEDPWQDGAIAIRFYDEEASVSAIVAASAARSIDGIVVVGDRPAVIAARVAQALGIPWHPPEAAAIAPTNSARANACAPPVCPYPSSFRRRLALSHQQ